MVDGRGHLITNRDIVSEDIGDFEYTPNEGCEGPVVIFNKLNEVNYSYALIFRFPGQRFISHIQEVEPTAMATFNGDYIDFPFFEALKPKSVESTNWIRRG